MADFGTDINSGLGPNEMGITAEPFSDEDEEGLLNNDETDPCEEDDSDNEGLPDVEQTTLEMGKDGDSSWRRPRKNMLCSISVIYKDETTIGKFRLNAEEEKQEDKFPLPCSLLTLLVAKVKRDHTVQFTIKPDFWKFHEDAIPEGVKDTTEDTTVIVKVVELHDEDDIGISDKPLMKMILVAGEGFHSIVDDSNATFEYSVSKNKETIVDRKEMSAVIGNGDFCDAMEACIKSMKKGEEALLTCTEAELHDEKLGVMGKSEEEVEMKIKLHDFDQAEELFSRKEDEKVSYCSKRKEVATKLIKEGRYEYAIKKLNGVAETFEHTNKWTDVELKNKAENLRKTSLLNLTLCYLKLEKWETLLSTSKEVLEIEQSNAKANFRKAKACFMLNQLDDGIKACKLVLSLDGNNIEARALYRELMAAQKAEDRKQKNLFGRMCKVIGTTDTFTPPISEIKKPEHGDDSEDDEEPLYGNDDATNMHHHHHHHGGGCCSHDHGHGTNEENKIPENEKKGVDVTVEEERGVPA